MSIFYINSGVQNDRRRSEEQRHGEAEVRGFRASLGPFVVAAEKTRMPMVFTAAGGKGRPIIFANASFVSLIGYDRAELLGMDFGSLLERGAPSEGCAQVQAAFEGQTQSDPEVKYQRRDGSVFWASLLISPVVDGDGKTVQHFISLVDLTKQKEEEQAIQLLQAEVIHLSRLSAMGAMAATLAHELNQPLAAIEMWAAGSEALIEQGAQSSDLRRPLADIRRTTARAGNIIHGLREMTRKGPETRLPIIPEKVIEDACKLAAVGACSGIKLSHESSGSAPVLGDPIQIEQVLINLIQNACDAVADTDEKIVLIRAEPRGKETLITVEDTGPGIAADHLPCLFDAFFTTKAEGMGMGLAISRTIIEAHGGHIKANNRREGGARLSFTLPHVGTA